jgi:hypothetical protein
VRLSIKGFLIPFFSLCLLLISSASFSAEPPSFSSKVFEKQENFRSNYVYGSYDDESRDTEAYNFISVQMDACYASAAMYCVSDTYVYSSIWRSANIKGYLSYVCGVDTELNTDTGLCEPAPVSPEECFENGQIYNNSSGYCVLDCPNGQLNGVCLQDISENAASCNTDTEGYQGYIGNGNSRQNICNTDTSCPGGSLGFVNSSLRCIPDEYSPPECSGKEVLTVGDFGTFCNPLSGAPEEEEEPKEPNTDTDGDGTPDEYKKENDPNSTDDAIDKLNETVSEGNRDSEEANKRLEGIGKGLKQIDDSIRQEGSETNQLLQDMKDDLEPPAGGFNPDGFGGLVPTFDETSSSFVSSLMAVPAVSTAVGMADMPENQLCPVYTIPSNLLGGPWVMDIHCNIISGWRGLISDMFLYFWAGTALIVFLRA